MNAVIQKWDQALVWAINKDLRSWPNHNLADLHVIGLQMNLHINETNFINEIKNMGPTIRLEID
jgi:hypothetical protein